MEGKPLKANVYLFEEDAHLLKISRMWSATLGWPQYVGTMVVQERRKDKAKYIVHRGAKFEVEPCMIKNVTPTTIPFYRFTRRLMSTI